MKSLCMTLNTQINGVMLIMLRVEPVVQVADESLGAQESPQSATDEVANNVIDAVEAHFVTTARWASFLTWNVRLSRFGLGLSFSMC